MRDRMSAGDHVRKEMPILALFAFGFLLFVPTRGLAEEKEQSPAPVIYDDFSDKRLVQRTGKDPWGRALPEWTVKMKKGEPEFTDGSVRFTAPGTIELPCHVTVGTWKWRYRYPNGLPIGPTPGASCGIIRQSNGSTVGLNNPTDGHWWLDYFARSELGGRWPRVPLAYYIINMVGSQLGSKPVAGTRWHEVVIARDAEGYVYTWLDGEFVRWSLDRVEDIHDSVGFALSAKAATSEQPVLLDDIQVYDHLILPPRHSIAYKMAANTIEIDGFDITLEEIAQVLNNPRIFSYDADKHIAVSNADIALRPGARLVISNATLKMASTPSITRKIEFSSDVTIRLNNATLTTTGESPFLWEGIGRDVSVFNGIIWIKDSLINNSGGLNIRGIDSLHLENSKFTNLVGKEPLSFAFTVPTHDLTIRDCLFEGKTGAETIVFRGGDQFGQLRPEPVGMDFVNCEFRKITFLRCSDVPYYQSPGRPGGTANLINCHLSEVSLKGTTLRYKYYLDVEVVTAEDKPVRSACVLVVNEQDDLRRPAENLLRRQKYLRVGEQVSAKRERYFAGQQGNWFKGWVDANDHRVTLTNRDGHTPLPRDQRGTFVITAAVQRGVKEKRTFTYTIYAETFDGKLKGEVSGIKPGADWYRANPNSYHQTVKVVVR